jgi:PAS domain S-box-containing protein
LQASRGGRGALAAVEEPVSKAVDATTSTPLSERAKRGLSIAHRLLLVVLVVAVPMLLLAAGIVWRLTERERDAHRDAIMYAGRSLLGAVDAQLGKYAAVAQLLGTSQALQTQNLAEFRADALRAMPGLPHAWVSLADTQGHQLVNTFASADDVLPPVPAVARESQRRAFETGQPQVVGVSTGPVAKIPVVAVVVPVFGHGRPAYSVFVTVDVAVFRDFLNSPRMPAGWLAAIVDRNGQFIARSLDHERWVGKPASPGWLPTLRQEGWFETLSLEDERYITANVVSSSSEWTLAVAAKKEVFEAPARHILFLAGLIGLVVTLASLVLATHVARRITGPIAAMESGARALRHRRQSDYVATGVREVDHALEAFDTAARDLRASEERYERLANATKEGVLICDGGRIVESNAGFLRMTGCDAGAVLDKPLGDFLAAETRDEALQRLAGSEGEVFESIGQRCDGTSFPVELSGGAITYNGRQMRVALLRDLTAEKRAEEDRRALQQELMRASRLSEIGRMAAALAHELNQPLTAVASYLGGCRRVLRGDIREPDTKEKLREVMELANAQALRAGDIIRRTREFFGTGQTRRTVEDAATVMREASTLAIAAAKHNGIAIRADIDPAGHILVDRVQIQQVIVNLVRNGIEAMEDSPRKELAIALSAQSDSIVVSVSDTGSGVSAEMSKRLFKPFSSTKSHGMGIGLSVCREIVEAHEGRIWAEPREGGGAVFRFTLPIVSDDVVARGI